jgi:hypothetical protein
MRTGAFTVGDFSLFVSYLTQMSLLYALLWQHGGAPFGA